MLDETIILVIFIKKCGSSIRKSNASAAGNIFHINSQTDALLTFIFDLKIVYTNHADKAKVSNT